MSADPPDPTASQAPVDAPEAGVRMHPVEFTPLQPDPQDADAAPPTPLDLILDVEVPVVVELGSAEMPIEDLLALRPGSVVELDQLACEPVALVIRGHVVARGEIIVVQGNFGIRISAVVDPAQRALSLA